MSEKHSLSHDFNHNVYNVHEPLTSFQQKIMWGQQFESENLLEVSNLIFLVLVSVALAIYFNFSFFSSLPLVFPIIPISFAELSSSNTIIRKLFFICPPK